jgi:hypothetical protein
LLFVRLKNDFYIFMLSIFLGCRQGQSALSALVRPSTNDFCIRVGVEKTVEGKGRLNKV